jgi:hypothetical protein
MGELLFSWRRVLEESRHSGKANRLLEIPKSMTVIGDQTAPLGLESF